MMLNILPPSSGHNLIRRCRSLTLYDRWVKTRACKHNLCLPPWVVENTNGMNLNQPSLDKLWSLSGKTGQVRRWMDIWHVDIIPFAWTSQLMPPVCWWACCWTGGEGAWVSAGGFPPPPKSIFERPWPMVEPIATDPAVAAIWAIMPGGLGSAAVFAGTEAEGAGALEGA